MSAPRYQVLLNSPGANNPIAHIVREVTGARFLGGFGRNFYRAWVFPLYTPAGFTVLQEFACDHPFHNGVFVAQHPVRAAGRVANLWVAPPRRSADDPLYVNVGRSDAPDEPATHVDDGGVRFTLNSIWRDEHEQPVVDEERTVQFRELAGATACDVTSRKIARYGPAHYPQTKYGSIGVRVEPRLLPPLGGVVLADTERRGSASVLDDRESGFVAYENDVAPGRRAGIFLCSPGQRGPWFVRDYGMAMLNPTLASSIDCAQGESWSVRLRVIAYDGALDEQRAAAWMSAP